MIILDQPIVIPERIKYLLKITGIRNMEELKFHGSKKAFAMMRIADGSCDIDLLFFLEALIRNSSPELLHPDVIQDLKEFYNSISYFSQVK